MSAQITYMGGIGYISLSAAKNGKLYFHMVRFIPSKGTKMLEIACRKLARAFVDDGFTYEEVQAAIDNWKEEKPVDRKGGWEPDYSSNSAKRSLNEIEREAERVRQRMERDGLIKRDASNIPKPDYDPKEVAFKPKGLGLSAAGLVVGNWQNDSTVDRVMRENLMASDGSSAELARPDHRIWPDFKVEREPHKRDWGTNLRGVDIAYMGVLKPRLFEKLHRIIGTWSA